MRKRILANYIVILIISALITGALAFYFINTSYTNNKKDKLLTNSILIENVLEKNYNDEMKVNFYKLAQELSAQINSRVTFMDENGWPIADSINNSIIFIDHSGTQEFKLAIKGEQEIVKRYSKEVGQKFFYLSMNPIKIGNKNIILRLGDSYNEVDHIVEKFLLYLTVSTFISILFAIIISYITTGQIVKPIKELTLASKLMTEGNFENKIKVNTKDEIGELSATFNVMAAELKTTIEKIKQKNIEMDSILCSIQDGILALDLNNKIFLVNNSVNKILQNKVKIGKEEDIKKVIDYIGNTGEIEKKINNAEDYYGEIEIKGSNKIIGLSIYPIIDKYQTQVRIGTLIVMRDITSVRNLEKMRKDFVANVSHELRTPLTSIGGFVETLKTKELDENNKKKALDIIELETEKLKNMINELLRLSKIESMKDTKIASKIDIRKEIFEILDLLEPQIIKNNINISLHMAERLNFINGDKELFRLIIINLIENSIKYNKYKGTIKIEISNYKNGIQLKIKDNGIGILEEDLPWIFERFYRSKETRIMNNNGTGLGLSIVKEIVSYFGGTIEVNSQVGKFSEFIVRLPEE